MTNNKWPLPYAIVIFWNGNVVLNGHSSAVMALETVKRGADNFTGAARMNADLEIVRFRDWLFNRHCEDKDQQINLLWGDETGSTCVRVTRL